MNVIVYVIAILGAVAGLASMLAVFLSINRTESLRKRAQYAAQDAVDMLARATRLQPEDIRTLGEFAGRPRALVLPLEDVRLSSDRIALLRRYFFHGPPGVRAEPRATHGGVGDIQLDAFMIDAEVRTDVLAGLRLLRALEQATQLHRGEVPPEQGGQ